MTRLEVDADAESWTVTPLNAVVAHIGLDQTVTLGLSDGMAISLRLPFVLRRGGAIEVTEDCAIAVVSSLLQMRVRRLHAVASRLQIGFDGSVEIRSMDSRAHKYLWNIVLPDGRSSVSGMRITAPDTSDQERLAQIAGNDGVLGQVRDVTHFFQFPFNRAGALATARQLRSEGDAGADEEIDDDDLWHVWAFRPQHISLEACATARIEMQHLAARHGGRYTGWDLTRRGRGHLGATDPPNLS
jgi:hypothetical protein